MPKLFPTHFEINLSENERSALEDIYEHDIYLRNEVELVHKAIRAGIPTLNHAAAERVDADHVTRTELEARTKAATRRTPKFAAVDGAVASHSRRPENYVGFPLPEAVRRRFELYLADHPEVTEEDAAAVLLDDGLSRAEVDPRPRDRDADGYQWGVQVFRQLRENLGLDEAPNEDRSGSSAKTAKLAALAERLRKKWSKRG